jgi:hypothetical protein
MSFKFLSRYNPFSNILEHSMLTGSGSGNSINVGDTLLLVMMARNAVTINSPGWTLVLENSGVNRPLYTQKIYIYKRVATGTPDDQTVEFSFPQDTPEIQRRLMATVLAFSGNVQVSGSDSGSDTSFCLPAAMPNVPSVDTNTTIVYGYHSVWISTNSNNSTIPNKINFFRNDELINDSLILDQPISEAGNRMTLGISPKGTNSLITTAHHDAPCFVDNLGTQAFWFSVLSPPPPSTTPTPTPTTTPTPTPNNTCDKKIIKLSIPGTVLSPGGSRASSIQLRIAGSSCCGQSNIIDVQVPPIPSATPTPTITISPTSTGTSTPTPTPTITLTPTLTSTPTPTITRTPGPSAPQNITIVPGNQSLSISWDPPAEPRGTIIGYTIRVVNPSGGSVAVSIGTTTTWTVSSLTNGSSYLISVLARTAVDGAFSEPVIGIPNDPATSPTPTPTATPTNPVSPSSNFDYVYKLLNLTYIGNIEYSIYGLDYEGSDSGGLTPPPVTPTPTPTTSVPTPTTPALTPSDYVYKLLNLTYISNIEYTIYGLDYEGSGGDSVGPTLLTNSYLYENEKTYSWF